VASATSQPRLGGGPEKVGQPGQRSGAASDVASISTDACLGFVAA